MVSRYLLLICLFVASVVHGEEVIFDFSQSRTNQVPAGFISVVGGEGAPGKWTLVEDVAPSAFAPVTAKAQAATKLVLAQVSQEKIDEHFPMLVYTNVRSADFTFSTRFKCVSGEMEQMAGVIFRYEDPQNYYYVRASSKGNTFRFFKVVGGQRSAPIGPEMPIPAGEWHELKVQMDGNMIKCFLNGKQAIPTMTDNSLASGFVGFWTKSDSVSYFTDARLEYKPMEPFAKKLLRDMLEKYPRVLGMRIYATPPGKKEMEVVATTRDEELGMLGGTAEKGVRDTDSPFFGQLTNGVVVTLPLHDRNGDIVGALRVEMKSFFGQTEENAVSRALPIAKDMEMRIIEARLLF